MSRDLSLVVSDALKSPEGVAALRQARDYIAMRVRDCPIYQAAAFDPCRINYTIDGLEHRIAHLADGMVAILLPVIMPKLVSHVKAGLDDAIRAAVASVLK